MKELIQKIKKGFAKQPVKDTFGDFFLRTPAHERTEILRNVARKSNEDQRNLLREYEKQMSVKNDR
ncbi:MAG: hypothetical protein COU06_00395 [Candidatus Harrisonbacteria bacterium CG10_big_fil_rev_8_21_14_0_10_38_8]|uniref:Uncharacterized protein n=1 Tax=Candidatus Harrisonbacteria bacterium CG10_big_fil_rev_8_21_14_0_10_38_8 TaxID=1974582 RepID=A0A2M6WKM7_9BACT|nr:MAG: hypothetical protein COU06_00395 [Candidatus Harrisonbacteria bacterium CG10_big_fil_rev_8_21_14_0_10_38_8]